VSRWRASSGRAKPGTKFADAVASGLLLPRCICRLRAAVEMRIDINSDLMTVAERGSGPEVVGRGGVSSRFTQGTCGGTGLLMQNAFVHVPVMCGAQRCALPLCFAGSLD